MMEQDKKNLIKKLESLAKEVLKHKQEERQRRPIVIEFCGSPKSGKTTTISSINIFFKRNDFKTVVLTERASICPIKKKTNPFFNIWTLTSAIAELLKYYISERDKYDIIIADRAIFDALCWFEWLNTNSSVENPYLNTEEYEILKNFALMESLTKIIDIVYVFKVPPATSIQREYANLLTEERGTIMREKVLSTFNQSIDSTVKKHSKNFRKLIKFDTSKQQNNQNRVAYDVTSNILNTLQDIIIEKIGYFKRESVNNILKSGINDISLINKLSLDFDSRNIIEKSLEFIQPIPVAVLTNEKMNKVLVVKKNQKSTSQTSPERKKILLYLGGHIRDEDKSESIYKTFSNCLKRELSEEIDLSITIQNKPSLIIYSDSNDKSKKHLCVCYVIKQDLDEKNFKPNPKEFIQKKGKSQSGHILELSEITKDYDSLEDWSKYILENIFNYNPPKGLFD